MSLDKWNRFCGLLNGQLFSFSQTPNALCGADYLIILYNTSCENNCRLKAIED